MSIVSITRWPGLDLARYDALVERMGWRESPPAGGTMHIAALDDDAMIFINVWESREAQERFTAATLPKLQAAGIAPSETRILDVHNAIAATPTPA
jgi:hypothetical protein